MTQVNGRVQEVVVLQEDGKGEGKERAASGISFREERGGGYW